MRSLLPVIVAAFLLSGCERIPELERRASQGKSSENSRHLVELKKWLWTCRGQTAGTAAFSKGKKDLGERIEEFVDYFQTKGLSTITSEEPSSILGTAVLWKETGYLLLGLSNPSEIKSFECSNGIIPWTKAVIKGSDHALDLVVLKLDVSVVPQIKSYLRWVARSEAAAPNEDLAVVSAAFPGQVDRISVQPQPFLSSMHTGIDDDLVLFLPPPPEVSAGGLLVDSAYRVLGYLIPRQNGLWGTAVTHKRIDFSVNAMIDKGNVPLPYAGLKLRVDSGRFIVQQIEVGSPAYRAGLRVDDIVAKWDKVDLKVLSDWQEMSVKDIGRTIPLTYNRGDKVFEAQLVLTAGD